MARAHGADTAEDDFDNIVLLIVLGELVQNDGREVDDPPAFTMSERPHSRAATGVGGSSGLSRPRPWGCSLFRAHRSGWCQKPLGRFAFMVGVAMAIAGTGAGVVEVMVCPIFMVPDFAVAVCS